MLMGKEGVTLRLKGYFCKARKWGDGFNFFHLTYNTEPFKPEIFTAAHPDIGKKGVLERLKIEVEDYLTYTLT